MLRSIKTNQLSERRLCFLVTGTGTAALTIGSDLAALTDNGTGNYTITPTKQFARIPVVQTTPVTDVSTCRVVSASVSAVVIEVLGADLDTAKDGVFYCQITGWDTADEFYDNL